MKTFKKKKEKLFFLKKNVRKGFEKAFLRIVCRGNVLPKQIYFMAALIMRNIKKQR